MVLVILGHWATHTTYRSPAFLQARVPFTSSLAALYISATLPSLYLGSSYIEGMPTAYGLTINAESGWSAVTQEPVRISEYCKCCGYEQL